MTAMAVWPWTRHRAPDPDAVKAVQDSEHALQEATMLEREAQTVADEMRPVGQRNHFAETWAAALRPRIEGTR